MMSDSLVTAEGNDTAYGLYINSSRKPSNAPEPNKVAELVFWTIDKLPVPLIATAI